MRFTFRAGYIFKAGLAMVLTLLFVNGCFVDLVRHENNEIILESNKQWYVSKITFKDGTEISPVWEEAKSNMNFNVNENRIFGISVCNNYFATFTLKGNKLKVSNIGSSRRMCFPNESMRYEYMFLKYLQGDFIVNKKDGKIRLEGQEATYYLQ
ncbi:META domain-containing protein [Helicobacter jaachi]|uniref:META domain-containing protein n=1 Tax=Helicobacter jaachi TaxID=1677920 RepID=A0A4U8T9M0_9HELI|nr:META domain-containing protein [Helicobacter jaachi]TLD96516.1 META domain-containing protein [Helicobacter jaachi]